MRIIPRTIIELRAVARLQSVRTVGVEIDFYGLTVQYRGNEICRTRRQQQTVAEMPSGDDQAIENVIDQTRIAGTVSQHPRRTEDLIGMIHNVSAND
jgi:hypothetical protein